MIKEIVRAVLNPNSEDWIVLQTNKAFYSLRLGGFKKANPFDGLKNYTHLSCPFVNQEIVDVYTDDEYVYILTENGGIIESGWVSINGKTGELYLGVKFSEREDFEIDYFNSGELFKLIVGSDGSSIKKEDLN